MNRQEFDIMQGRSARNEEAGSYINEEIRLFTAHGGRVSRFQALRLYFRKNVADLPGFPIYPVLKND